MDGVSFGPQYLRAVLIKKVSYVFNVPCEGYFHFRQRLGKAGEAEVQQQRDHCQQDPRVQEARL